MIYLDYNATAPLRPSVAAAMAEVALLPLNPSSSHGMGRQAKKLLEDARQRIAHALSAFQNEVLFVASATEANNMVLRAFAADRALLVSAVEHASLAKTGKLLGADTLRVDAQGVIKLDELEAKLENLGERKALVSVMLANNETGVIQPIAEIAAITRKYGALLHTDAVQALGKITIDWGLLGADMLTVSAHKVGGAVGMGALLIRNDLPIKNLMTGGGQELGRRPGTQHVPSIVGFAKLVEEVASCPESKQQAEWRDWLEAELLAAAPQAQVFGTGATRLPNTINIALPSVSSETQLMNLDLAGFAVSAGSACSSGKIEPSPVLLAMGVSPELAASAIRISFGWHTSKEELEKFAAAWKAMAARLGNKQAA
jgi:cysteine desulfurase